ncbi:Ribosomal RNA-processing protein [Paramyrothecium foliicola]|nr:Ribosomal RNA-processing protein [Paramyrothecium foliicola]
MAAEESQMPFIRNLASSEARFPPTDRKLRNASLESIQNFIASRKDLPLTDALKLWKGLYYAHWMTDRPKPQQALANDLAELLFRLPAKSTTPARNVIPWLQAFWTVLSMQWTDIDVLRMDKFLLLVRRVFAAQIRWAAQQGFKGEGVDALVRDVLAPWCFDAECDLRRVPVGLRLHVLDLWVDELEREGALKADDEHAQRFLREVGDLVEVLRTCPVKPARERARDTYDDERLPWGTRKADEDEDEELEDASGDDDEWGGIDD